MIAIYARVSTEEQLKGYSIEGQIEDCLAFAGTRNAKLYVDDGYTGEILNRPSLSKLLADVEAGFIRQIICYDPDRLSRKLLNQLLITEKLTKFQVQLNFVKSEYKNDAEGQLYFQVRGAFSEFDKAKIKHNTMTGKYRKAKQGYVVKDSGLYGYDYCTEQKTYVINKREANIVQMIFDYFTNPAYSFQGVNGIAQHLTKTGIQTARGAKVWHRQVVRQILMNEAYTGVYYQNRYDTEGNYVKKQAGEKYASGRLRPRKEWIQITIPAIIAKDQFNDAQERLKVIRRRYAGYSYHDYLLSGLVRCARCGGKMTGRKTNSHGKKYYVYHCRKNNTGLSSTGCGRMISEKKLNENVWLEIEEWISKIKEVQETGEWMPKSYVLLEIEEIQKQIKNCESGRKRLLELLTILEDDDIDLQEIKEKIHAIHVEERELSIQLKEKEQQLVKERNPNRSVLKKAIDSYFRTKNKILTTKEKQEILRVLIKEVQVVDADRLRILTF